MGVDKSIENDLVAHKLSALVRDKDMDETLKV
jgi:hypothetical protein